MIRVIPAIDIIDGRCVRLKRGNFTGQTVYYDDPLDIAMIFHRHGLKRLHLVDLDGARAGRIVNYRILEKIFEKTGMIIDFGGGIRQDSDIEIAFRSGAAMITAGTVAVGEPLTVERWIERYGPEKIILGADFYKGKIAVNAWQDSTSHDIIQFIGQYRSRGIRNVICTDISRDGMMQGPSFDVYRQLRIKFSDIGLVASGGITTPSDLDELDRIGLDGAVIGRALYEQTIKFEDINKYLT
jgi:phosphoribosylformimino-5-aminoimidazole carboxamide ribotide isomerase